MHSSSAQSYSCKRSLHTKEVVRRLLNSSVRLDWDQEVAPVITTYMSRLRRAGYDQKFRELTLTRALGIYDKMKKEDEDGQENGSKRKNERKKLLRGTTGPQSGVTLPLFLFHQHPMGS